jgi:hypothetical protein
MSRPEALLRSEFDYLHDIAKKFDSLASFFIKSTEPNRAMDEDVIFLDIWFCNIDENLNEFDSERFYVALREPKFVQAPKDWQPTTDDIEVRTVKDAERVLQMLSADLFKTEKEIKAWVNMQLRYVHQDKLNGMSEEIRKYAERQTKAIYAAKDILVQRIKNKK